MTLIGPFTLAIQPGSTSSSVVSGSLFDAADSITLFASGPILAMEAALEGAPNLGVEFPNFTNLTVPGGSPTGSQIAISEFEAVIVNPVPAVAGFRISVDVPPVVTESYDLVGRTAPGVNTSGTQSIDARIVGSTTTQSVDARIVGSTVTQSVNIDEPLLITGSVEVVASTGSVTLDEQPIEVTGSVTTAASTIATQSVSIVDSRVTQSVDLAFDDTIRIIASSSVVITPAQPDGTPGRSPGGVPIQTFASMSPQPI